MLNKKIENLAVTLSRQSWLPFGLLFLVTVTAAGLRFFKLGEWSFWIDEIYTINHSTNNFGSPELILANIPPARNWIPLSVILTAQVLNTWGVNEWSARFVSVVIGVLTIPILYLPLKKLFGSPIALIAIVLLAISPWHIFWSQNARFYASLMLFSSLALFAFYFGIEEDEPKYLLLFFVLVYLATSERLFALFIFPVVALYLASLWILRFEKPKGMNLRNLLIITLPILIGGAVELYNKIVEGESRFFADFSWFFQYQVEDPFRLLISIIYNIGFPVFSLGLVAGIYVLVKKNRLGLFILISALLPVLLLVIMNPFIFTKERYVFTTLPFWLLLCAIVIWELFLQTKGVGKYLALGLLIVLMADAAGRNVQYYLVNHGGRPDWRAAFQVIQENSQSKDVVVAWWPEFSPFYLGKEVLPTEKVTPVSVLESGQRYWFLIDSETVWGNIPLRDFLERDAQLVDVLYLRLPEDDTHLKLYLYDPAVRSLDQ